MTPHQLFDLTCSNIPAAYFRYCSNVDYVREQSNVEHHSQFSCTIPGMRKLHSFAPISNSNSTVEVNFTHHLMFPGKRELL